MLAGGMLRRSLGQADGEDTAKNAATIWRREGTATPNVLILAWRALSARSTQMPIRFSKAKHGFDRRPVAKTRQTMPENEAGSSRLQTHRACQLVPDSKQGHREASKSE